MTSEATANQIPDVYGQVHPVETIDLISKKQKEFELELQKLPTSTKVNLTQAEEKCPELLSDRFKLKFLRAEVFNADVRTINAKKFLFRPIVFTLSTHKICDFVCAVSF